MSRQTTKQANPILNNDYFVKLLEIEEQYQSGTITHSIISSLTEIYATCIEYYDRFQDPVSVYFHEKLQSLLSSSKTIQALYIAQKQSNEDPKKVTTFASFSPLAPFTKETDSSMRNVIQSAPDLSYETQQQKIPISDPLKILSGGNPDGRVLESLTKKRKERSTKLNIIMQMQEQKQTCEEVQVIELIDNYEKTANETQSIIQNSLKDQGDQLNQRLEKRKFTQKTRTNSLAGGDYKFTTSRDKLQTIDDIPDYILQLRQEFGK